MKARTFEVRTKAENEHLYQQCKNHLKNESKKAAYKYRTFGNDPDEFVSEAWLRGLEVKNPKFLKKRIKYNMMDFIRDSNGLKRIHNYIPVTNILNELHVDGGGDIYYDRLEWFNEISEYELELQDMIDYIISFSKLSKKEKKYARMIAKGWTATEIAKEIDSTMMNVSQVFQAAKNKMKEAIKENDIIW